MKKIKIIINITIILTLFLILIVGYLPLKNAQTISLYSFSRYWVIDNMSNISVDFTNCKVYQRGEEIYDKTFCYNGMVIGTSNNSVSSFTIMDGRLVGTSMRNAGSLSRVSITDFGRNN